MGAVEEENVFILFLYSEASCEGKYIIKVLFARTMLRYLLVSPHCSSCLPIKCPQSFLPSRLSVSQESITTIGLHSENPIKKSVANKQPGQNAQTMEVI